MRKGKARILSSDEKTNRFASPSWDTLVATAVSKAQFNAEKQPSIKQLKEKLHAVKVGSK